MLYWIISIAIDARRTFSRDNCAMSAWFFSTSALISFVRAASSAEAWRELADGMARHASTRSFVRARSFSQRSSMSWIVCTTRWSSTGRDVETARGAEGPGEWVRGEGERTRGT